MKQFRTIKKFFRQHKRLPSYGEIMALFNFKSKNSASRLVKKMMAQGFLQQDETRHLLPGPYFYSTKILGTVEAGFPSPAEEELQDTMSLDEFLIDNQDATYMLRVSGDSMIDAGIMPGDLVLVERGCEAKNGDIVIAEVDSGWTMKYLHRQANKITLEPANKKYKTIIPKNELKIAAIVKAVIRKY